MDTSEFQQEVFLGNIESFKNISAHQLKSPFSDPKFGLEDKYKMNKGFGPKTSAKNDFHTKILSNQIDQTVSGVA